MDIKTKLRCRVARRKCNQVNKKNSKIERSECLRKVSNILRKKESLRSPEEKAVLASMAEEVKEVKFRLCRKQRTIERNQEIEDEYLILRSKCKKLANALQRARHLVVYTGAGISTSADIPDYRGPNGIWTLLQQGKQIRKHDLTRADPTVTHMALWQLYRKRYLKFIVSQNCDGLHLRSGLPKRALSEVHGNMYIEVCRECKPNVQYWRLFDTTEKTARFSHKTGRICHKCGSSLVDSIVHFGERGIAQWPLNWAGALHHAAKADVILCLGSSLKVLKKYPWLWAMDKPIKKRPAIFIVNLQWTPKDDVAELKINGRCDIVMKLLMEFLGLETPKYDRNNDPIFAHTSYLSPKELHTTTQPMLIKSIISASNNTESKEDNKKQSIPSNSQIKIKKLDIDEDDEDCPLNILKIKMAKVDLPEDLSVNSNKNTHFSKNIEMDMVQKLDVSAANYNLKKQNEIKIESHLNHIIHKDIDTKRIDGTCVEMKTADFSCTVNVDEKNSIITKSEFVDDLNQSNLKINAFINNNLNVKSETISSKKISDENEIVSRVEGISMEILAEEFERVHVKMKTNENEIHQVSILLVNKSKTPPKSCDKFQQTDPEILDTNNSTQTKEDLQPELKFIDTGQLIDNLKKELTPQLQQLSSHVIIDAHCISSQSSANGISITSDIHKHLDLSCQAKLVNSEKSANPLRKFRILKDVKKNIFNHFNFGTDPLPKNYIEDYKFTKPNIVETLKNQILPTKKLNQCENIANMLSEKPLDFSMKNKTPMKSCIRVPKFTPERKVNHSYILKIPKPVFINRNSYIDKNHAIDLSICSNKVPSKANETKLSKNLEIVNHNNANKKCSYAEDSKDGDDESLKSFKRKCEIIAKAIIQNTLQVNHNELQTAYSGIHSIINPVPFNVQYDFKSVFNAFNFINLGQKLISKSRYNTNKSNDYSIINKVVNNKKSDLITKRRLLNRTRFSSKKKQPQCTFCFEQYKTNMCNFYFPFNSDDRFEKYCNNKLVMCDCCGQSETSSESDDDISLMERKKKFEEKRREESAESECNSNGLDNNKLLNDKANDDLKKCVQIRDKYNNSDSCESKETTVQAGWFGKGFRKNRRRRR